MHLCPSWNGIGLQVADASVADGAVQMIELLRKRFLEGYGMDYGRWDYGGVLQVG